MAERQFSELLRSFRARKGYRLADIKNPDKDLSSSYLGVLESGRRSKDPDRPILTRGQIWYLVRKLELWPPECDVFLEAAGHSADRTQAEELYIQQHLALQEMWVFARVILDSDPSWYPVVRDNVARAVKYVYFTHDLATFWSLQERLQRDPALKRTKPRPYVPKFLELIEAPSELFIANFAIYNPGSRDMYGCGAKTERGKAQTFYTMKPSEADRLYELLRDWRNHLSAQRDIVISPLRRVYPQLALARFVPEHLESSGHIQPSSQKGVTHGE